MIHVGNGAKITTTGGSNGIRRDSGNITLGYNVTLEAKGNTAAVKNSLVFTPDEEQCTASTSYDGSSSVTYDADDLDTYKYIKVTSAPHAHKYGAWSSDEANHWHECTDPACPDKTGSIKDKGAHADIEMDHKCDTCGKTLSECVDANKDNRCDICGKVLSSGGSSGGGGGGSSPSTNPVQTEVGKDPDGSVSLSKTSAAKGDKVTITVKPEQHYEVDEVIVRDSKGKQLAVKDNGDGTFTFEMPADKVTVEPTFTWVNPFADVANSAYYVDAVEWMLKREVTQGTTDTMFSPNLNCTRAQSAAFLYRAAGSPAVSGSAGFSDVAADAYYAQAVAWAKEHGITGGIGGGLFGSANDCTRAQIAAFLFRAYNK